jgi:hypothetical protein
MRVPARERCEVFARGVEDDHRDHHDR